MGTYVVVNNVKLTISLNLHTNCSITQAISPLTDECIRLFIVKIIQLRELEVNSR